jgi:two-component system LytT family response regulator
MKLKAIIIDDEKMARTLLAGMLKELDVDVEILELCEDLSAGVKAIRKHKPDLVFLDIEMPGHSGLELLDFFNEDEITFSIVFTTAYNQYAIQAFKLSAIDYLLKPVSVQELEHAIQKVKRNLHEEKAFGILKENLLTNPLKKIAVNTITAIKFVELDKVVYLKADGAYTEFVLTDNTTVTSSKGLKHYEDVLDEQTNFMRCHKSYLVNLNHVGEFIKGEGGHLLMSNSHQVSISGEKADEFIKRMMGK